MPHVHGVVWLDKNYLQPYLNNVNKTEYNDRVVELIDSMITCQLPSDDEKLRQVVTEVQKHNHTKSCRKYSGTCRFGYPRFPSDRTIIAKPPPSHLSDHEQKEMLESAAEILSRARLVLESDSVKDDMTFDEFLLVIDVSKEDYINAISLSLRGKVVVLKRDVSERYINNYNKEFLTAWNANMDIQFCYDPHAVCTYISDYVGKCFYNHFIS
jgi:hypothetical protein